MSQFPQSSHEQLNLGISLTISTAIACFILDRYLITLKDNLRLSVVYVQLMLLVFYKQSDKDFIIWPFYVVIFIETPILFELLILQNVAFESLREALESNDLSFGK